MLSGTFEVFVKIIKNHAAAEYNFFLNISFWGQRGSDPMFKISLLRVDGWGTSEQCSLVSDRDSDWDCGGGK